MTTADEQMKDLSVEGKVKMNRQIENGKRKLTCVENLVSLILRSKRFGKQNQND